MSDDRPQTALVTGARRGIGRAIAVALSAAGFNVAITDVVDDELSDETVNAIRSSGGSVAFFRNDLADIESHRDLVDEVEKRCGPISCLVNNAGVQVTRRTDLLDVQSDSFDRVMGINLRGTFFLTQTVARRMIEHNDARPKGPSANHRSIITISSANVFMVGPDRPEYCFSKSSLSLMSRMFALRLADAGIASYEIRPGIMRTDMTAPAAEQHEIRIRDGVVPARRWGEPEDVGRCAATLACGLISFSTGDAFHVDGGLHIQRL